MAITPMTIDCEASQPLWKRLAWFVGLWAGGVAVVGSIAFLIRFWLKG